MGAPTPMIVYDMPMMSKFVADFYQQKVSEIKSLQAKLAASAPGDIQRSSGEGVTRHPGDDRDSDDEAEGKVPAAAKKPLETISTKWKQWVRRSPRRCPGKIRQLQS